MGIEVRKLENQEADEGLIATASTYRVMEGEKEFIISYAYHPHRGSSLTLAGKEGTLHIRAEDDTVVRQVVALGGGCALAIREEVVDGLSPDSLRAVIAAQSSES